MPNGCSPAPRRAPRPPAAAARDPRGPRNRAGHQLRRRLRALAGQDAAGGRGAGHLLRWRLGSGGRASRRTRRLVEPLGGERRVRGGAGGSGRGRQPAIGLPPLSSNQALVCRAGSPEFVPEEASEIAYSRTVSSCAGPRLDEPMEIDYPTYRHAAAAPAAIRRAGRRRVHALLQDPEVVRYVGDRRVPTLQETWRAITGWIGHWALRGYGMWAVEERDSGAVVGRAGLVLPGRMARTGGCYLARPRLVGSRLRDRGGAGSHGLGLRHDRFEADQPHRSGQHGAGRRGRAAGRDA